MALIHRATVTPTKLELLQEWLPDQPWCAEAGTPRQLGSYRFDDPAGEVGIETMLVRTRGSVLQVPLTYRGAPLDGAEEFLVGTTEHSVLGQRWVYDGCGDPVWASALVETVLTGGTQVEELVDFDGQLQARQPTATVSGSGRPGSPVPAITAVEVRDGDTTTVVTANGLEVQVARVVGTPVAGDETLTGHWGDAPAALAAVSHRRAGDA